MTLLILAFTFVVVNRYQRRLEIIAGTDSLTGLMNRQAFEIVFEQAILDSERRRIPLSIILFDIDFFKLVNDNHGHLAGDRILKDIAIVTKSALRESDIVARWGGEEFLVLLKDCPLEKAVALAECATPAYQKYAKDVIVNAQALTTALEAEGMRAVSGGTQTHLALIDIRGTGVNGKVADERCGNAGIVLNKNSIPFDPEKPAISSGIRVGTPATTTQGMGVEEMKQIASLISRAIRTGDDAAAAAAIKSEVHALTARFPIYNA